MSQPDISRRSVEACRKATSIRPDDVTAWIDLGIALDYVQNEDGAADAFRKAIALDPANAIAWYRLGMVSDENEAIKAFRKAIDLKPDYVDPWDSLGDLLLDKGDIEGGIAAFRSALAIDPDNDSAQFNLKWALEEKKSEARRGKGTSQEVLYRKP